MNDVVGTPYWMAPEVIEMSGATDRSDVWSVGCTVIELLTGSPPYADLPQVPALFRIVQDLHPPLPDLAAQDSVLHDFLMRCFQKDPQDRADAQSLSEHSWLIEMNQSIDETIGHDIEAADGGAMSAWSPLDEESEEDDAPNPTPSPPAALVPHARASGDISSSSSSSRTSSLSRSAAASTVVSPEQQERHDQLRHLQKHQGLGAGLTSTISRHRELSDTIRFGRSSVHGGAGRGSLRVSRSSGGSSISSTGRWEPMVAEQHGEDISMTSLSSLSALASGEQPLPAAGHAVSPFEVGVGLGASDRRPDAARHQRYGRAGAEARHDRSHPHALQAYNGSASSYSYTPADPQKEAEGGAEEGSEEAATGGDAMDTAAAAAAALELDIQPQATEDWEETLREFASSSSLEAGDAVDEADEDTKEARRWIEQLKAPNRSGGGSTAAGPISAVSTRDDSHHQACVALVTLFFHSPAKKSCLITEHGILALIEILEKRMEVGSEASNQLRVQVAAMILINQVTRADSIFQEKLCLVGVLPVIVQLAKNATAPSFARPSQASAGATAAKEQGTAGATVVSKNGACMLTSACPHILANQLLSSVS